AAPEARNPRWKNSGSGRFRHDARGGNPPVVRRRLLMRILLDTNVLLCAVGRSRRLNAETIDALSDSANDVLFRAVSFGELAVKFALKRADFDAAPHYVLQGALAIGFVELPVTA